MPSISGLIKDIVPGELHEIQGMKIRNITGRPIGQLLSFLPHDIRIDEAVFLPDMCPGRSALPTGTVVQTKDPRWHRLAVSDCGCGMQLVRADLTHQDFDSKRHLWDELGNRLKRHKGGLGDLGGGNHFLDALAPYDSTQPVHFLIHTGSRLESGLVDHLVNTPSDFKREFSRVVGWARDNRDKVRDTIQSVFGPLELVVDLPHNTFEERTDGSVIIRKGVVHSKPGTLSILPSHMTGDVSLIRAGDGVVHTLESLCHGTGRSLSRGEARNLNIDTTDIRKRVYIPDYIQDSSLRTEGPHAYRSLAECQSLLGNLASEVDRFAVIAYLGHL